jgi:undecaprenyl-diphosphatase
MQSLTDAHAGAQRASEAARETLARGEREPRVNRWQALDASIFSFINNLHHTPDGDDLVAAISDIGRGAGWLAAAAWLAWRGGRRGRRAAIECALALAISTSVVEGPLKRVFRRRRPFDVVATDVLIGRPPRSTSFPSGHTATSFACATALAAGYPEQSAPLFLAALLVGLSRIYVGQHFPSDVAGGAVTGTVLGASTVALARRAGPQS